MSVLEFSLISKNLEKLEELGENIEKNNATLGYIRFFPIFQDLPPPPKTPRTTLVCLLAH